MRKKSNLSFHLTIFILALVFLASFIIVKPFLEAIFYGAAIAFILNPLVDKLENKLKINRRYASAVIIILFSLPIFLFLLYFVSFLLDPQNLKFIAKTLYSGTVGLRSRFEEKFKSLGIGGYETLAIEAEEFTNEILAKILSTLREFASDFIIITAKFVILIITSYYLLVEGRELKSAILGMIPERTPTLLKLFQALERIAYGVIMGYFLTSALVGAIAGIGFYIILDIPTIYAIILAVITGVAAFLPIIGPWLIYGLIALYEIAIVDELSKGIAVFLFGVIFLSTIPDFYVRPILAKRGARVHPLILLLGFIGGPLVFGKVLGILLGPIILALFEEIFRLYRQGAIREIKEIRNI